MSSPNDEMVASLTARYVDAQLKGERQRAVQLLIEDGIGKGLSPSDLLLQVITPAQREIGRLWETNEASVADEHVATAISQLAMTHLYARTHPTGVRREHVLIACVEGEWHDMGARVAADVLEHHGFSVCLLGASVPIPALRERVVLEAPDVVLLSVTMPAHATSLTNTLQMLRADFPTVPVLVGGRAAGDADHGARFPLPNLTAQQAAVCMEVERLLRG